MGIGGLQWQTIQVPLAAGLQLGDDPRAMQPPGLLIAKDLMFDEAGGVQTRYPFASIGASIHGGGTLSGVRRLTAHGSELVVFTTTGVYSWSDTLTAWVLKGTHLAVKVDETDLSGSAGDQLDADRAELNGTIFYSWIEEGGVGYYKAVDKETGTVLQSRRQFSAGASRARLVALTTKVLLVFADGITGLYAYALDPAAPTAALGSSTTVLNSGIAGSPKYDIVRVASTDTAIIGCARTVTTSYSLLTVTAALVVTATTKARTCTGAIAVSVEPTGASVQVIRANATDVQGDLIAISGFADTYTAQAVGTTPTAAAGIIAACHRSVTDSAVYRCYAFWASSETSGGASDWYTSSNWVSTGNTLGTEAIFKRRWAPRARAFDRSGEIYVWGAFYGRTEFDPFGDGVSLQSTYFLLRDDGFLAAKAVTNTAGAGAGGIANDGNGWIPGCVSTSSGVYAFAAVSCRVILTGGESERQSRDYAARSPRDVVFTFDSNEARRCARIGATLYIACGEGLLQYDGTEIMEVGFHQAPWYIIAAETAGGSIATDGTYAFKMTWRAANANGEVERSAGLVVGAVTVAAQPGGVALQGAEPLFLTHRGGQVAWEAWRTKVNPVFDSPFYLVTTSDPTDLTNPNRFVFNDTAAGSLATVNDELADADIEDNEQNPDNGGLLESTQPPPCTIVVANTDRLFLAGIAGNPHQVWYSKQRQDNEVASFNDSLRFTVPREGGAITGLAFLNETLIVFKEAAVYAVPGDGFDNLGGGQTFGPARLLASDVGAVSQEAIALTPNGLVFKSSKGWYLLNRGWSANYIGAPVSDYDSDTVLAVHVLEDRHEVRCLTSSRMLVLDYSVPSEASPHGQWSEWSITSGTHAAMWNGTHHYSTDVAVLAEGSDYTTLAYGLDLETGWIKLNDLQGYGRIRKIRILGENGGIAYLRVRVARNYATTYFQDKVWTIDPTVSGDPLEVLHSPSIQQCEAIKIRISAITLSEGGDVAIPSTGAIKLTGLALELGFYRGINKRLPAAQKQ